jgi:hypothetical protein
MIEMLKDLFNPIFWLTVVPLGAAFLAIMWKRDSKQIAEQHKDKS